MYTTDSDECNEAHSRMQRNDHNGRHLRNNMNLVITTNTYNRNNTISENAAKLWNGLTLCLKTIEKRETFKDKYRNQRIYSYT